MDKDIRLLFSFKGHRKRKRLKMHLGEGYLDYLIDLWLSAAEDRPDGTLTGWDEIDIALSSGWEKDPTEYVDALIDSGWLDKNQEGVFVLHNWHKRQGWCVGSEDRSKKARIAALIKSHGRDKGLQIACEQHGIDPNDFGYPYITGSSAKSATGIPPASHRHATRHATRHAPSPSPSPTPKEHAFNKLKAAEAVKSSKHFAQNTGKLSKHITTACRELNKLSKSNGKKFNSFAFVQQKINNRGHPGAVLDSLDGLAKLWRGDGIKTNPWAVAQGIFNTVNGNYNEADAIKEANKFKDILNDIAKSIAMDKPG